ncbi:MAG: phosphoenolpyruvate carboxykinase (ATP), partial [Caulobacterales bacterium]|nr:phosphoenolpyruvate carboxykinase (ATP) [Caulobacterales bacterium]
MLRRDELGVEAEGLIMTDHNGVLQYLGVHAAKAVHHNWVEAALYAEAVRRGEGDVAEGGPLVVKTGQHTGRSAKDKYTVRDALTEDNVWWDNNQSMTPEHFAALWSDFQAHMTGGEYFVQDLFGGADPAHRVSVRVVNEFAWHSLFIRHLLRVPTDDERAGFAPQFTIVNLPSFRADPERHGCRSETVIAVNFAERLVLIGGTGYAGETKKSVFTILNYLLPQKGVLPMHCSVNVGAQDDAAVFFGLSGTGKTTLSADPARTLVGDDEHGWSRNGLFNFEGGCYAKMIKLSAEAEPEIYATTRRFGTILENCVYDPQTREIDYDDASLTENTRGCYPIEFLENLVPEGHAGHPKN